MDESFPFVCFHLEIRNIDMIFFHFLRRFNLVIIIRYAIWKRYDCIFLIDPVIPSHPCMSLLKFWCFSSLHAAPAATWAVDLQFLQHVLGGSHWISLFSYSSFLPFLSCPTPPMDSFSKNGYCMHGILQDTESHEFILVFLSIHSRPKQLFVLVN